MDGYVDADFTGLWVNEILQDYMCDKIRTGCVVIFANFPLFWVSKLQIYIALSTLNDECVDLYHSVIDLLPLRIIIK